MNAAAPASHGGTRERAEHIARTAKRIEDARTGLGHNPYFGPGGATLSYVEPDDTSADIELRETRGRGEGVFALRSFERGATVLTGVLEERDVTNHSHASQLGPDEFGFHSGLTSKFNHSCDPNCGIRVNGSGAHDFVARRAIAKHEETTFDYAMRNYRIDHFPGDCSCGRLVCRGEITGWQDLPQARKDAYRGYVAPYLIELDHAAEAG